MLKTELVFGEFRLSHDVAASADIPNSPSDSEVNLVHDFGVRKWWFGGAISILGGERITEVFEESIANSFWGTYSQGV